jgi:hypothetical protein
MFAVGIDRIPRGGLDSAQRIRASGEDGRALASGLFSFRRLGAATMPKRTFFHELAVSWRHQDGHLACCFVTITGVEPGSHQRAVLESRHLTGRPEQLVDSVLQLVRELTLEHVLSPEEPF